MSYLKNSEKGVEIMCKIVEDFAKEYAKEVNARTVVEHIENLAKNTGDINKACELIGISRKQYDEAKELFEEDSLSTV